MLTTTLKEAQTLAKIVKLGQRTAKELKVGKGIKLAVRSLRRKKKRHDSKLVRSIPNPVSYTYTVPRNAPRAMPGRNKRVNSEIFRHREMLSNMVGNASFAAEKVNFNPGLPRYVWLSKVAQRWSRYKVRRLRLFFVPSQAVTSTPGTIYLAANHDPNASTPTSENSLSSYDDNISSPVYKTCTLDVKTAVSQSGVQWKKIRDTPIGNDLQLYDTCSLIFASTDCADGVALGKLWVEYEIEMISSIIEDHSPSAHNVNSRSKSGSQVIADTVEELVDFNVDTYNPNTLQLSDVSGETGLYTIPKGAYMVYWGVQVEPTISTTDAIILSSLEVDSEDVGPKITGEYSMKTGQRYSYSSAAYIVLEQQSEIGVNITMTDGLSTPSQSFTVRPGATYLLIVAIG